MQVQILRDTYKSSGSLHHACLIQGDRDAVLDGIFEFIEQDLAMSVQGNPDVQVLEFDTFGISDGKLLSERAVQKALGERKIFVATFNTMTLEAQNSLLKLFEEPTPNTHFFLVSAHTDSLLKTLRSRMFILEVQIDATSEAKKDAKAFLEMSPKDRLAHVKKLAEAKDKNAAMQFLNALEEAFYQNGKASLEANLWTSGLEAISYSKQYVLDRGSSLKLLLEHVALVLPQVK